MAPEPVLVSEGSGVLEPPPEEVPEEGPDNNIDDDGLIDSINENNPDIKSQMEYQLII